MDIGKIIEIIEVEPIDVPIELPDPEPVPVEEPDAVPA
jgi:hypothetical protein